MKAFPLSSPLPSLHSPKSLIHAQLRKPNFSKFGPVLLPLLHSRAPSKFKLFSSPVSADHHVPLEAAEGTALASERSEKFDWYSQWYPLMPVCDLDKKVPRALMVLGMDVVVWWDRNENAWKVFDDMCPHRLAPLSEGRIDPAGRLQCVYHGWCFDGSGNCKLIPQAPADGPPRFRQAKGHVLQLTQQLCIMTWCGFGPTRILSTKTSLRRRNLLTSQSWMILHSLR
ncbi:unnamed protein product [Linum tenue]|uniref:Rieske domain-containing protein n=1 Tax=Linum tenue TaxID=586396 RepID=A0AAV0RQG5_9ROSI|nr:unnamed protein product [Linum tenue]